MEDVYINYHTSFELNEQDWTATPVINKDDFSIWIFPTEQSPHINIYEGSMTLSTKCCRLSLIEPKYLFTSDCDVEDWILTDEEKRRLIAILQSQNNTIGFFGESSDTVWDYIIKLYNFQVYCNTGIKCILPEDLPIPDYRKL